VKFKVALKIPIFRMSSWYEIFKKEEKRMSYQLKNMSWTQFNEKRKASKTVLIPSGACEVYGPHLPLGSDIIVANKICELVAEKVNGIVAPCLEVGQSKTITDFPGTIAISGETLARVYTEIIKNFVDMGFENFFMISGHYHNIMPLQEVLENFRKSNHIRYGIIGWWQFMQTYAGDIVETDFPYGHAAEAGTSTLLYLAPELVNMEEAVNSPSKYDDKWAGITPGLNFHDYTDTGVMGDATKATAEKGKRIVDRGVERISDYIKNCLEKE